MLTLFSYRENINLKTELETIQKERMAHKISKATDKSRRTNAVTPPPPIENMMQPTHNLFLLTISSDWATINIKQTKT